MSEFKGQNGVQYTQQLFYEFGNKDAPYTLRPEDHTARSGKTYKSFSAIYLECVDEYDAAITLLGSWKHWKKLMGLDWFINGYDTGAGYKYDGLVDWRKQMKLRDESVAKRQLMEAAKQGNISASKYLHECANKSTKTAGRPSKQTNKPKAVDVASIVGKAMGNGSK